MASEKKYSSFNSFKRNYWILDPHKLRGLYFHVLRIIKTSKMTAATA